MYEKCTQSFGKELKELQGDFAIDGWVELVLKRSLKEI